MRIRYIIQAITFLFAVLAGVILYNCIADKHSVFERDFSRIRRGYYYWANANFNFSRMAYLLDHRNEFDSILLGSSRGLVYDVSTIPGGRYFNFSMFLGYPSIFRENLKYCIDNGMRFRNVIVLIDEVSFRHRGTFHDKYLIFHRLPHDCAGKVRFYGRYLTTLPTTTDIKYLLGIDCENKRFTISDKGVFFPTYMEDKIEASPQKHIESEIFNRPWIGGEKEPNYEGCIQDIRDIKKMCDDTGARLILIINPTHKSIYNYWSVDEFNVFRKKLAQVSDYWDFSGLNSVNTNNYYFFETSHYRKMVADMMTSRVFNVRLREVPADFGVFVTKRTVNQHTMRLKQASLRNHHKAR
ncbi:MAG: hypothetical protein JXA20_11200 [Spirochaetes bacterium]|nr:hypothetical protein [Spirochaetota bacterium]